MKLLEQSIQAAEVKQMIDARLERVTMSYQHAVAQKDKVAAEVMAETKWQLAELKMQFVDLLIEKLDQ